MPEDLQLKTKKVYLDTSEESRDAIIRMRQVLNLKNRQAYFIAVALGFKYGRRVEKFKKSSVGLPRIENLRNQDIVMMSAIQLATTGSPESLLDHEAMCDLTEQFAEGGGLLLISSGVLEQGPEATKKWLTKELKQAMDGLPEPKSGPEDEE